MLIETLREKLGQDVDFVKTGIEAVTDGDIDQTVLAGNRDRWF